MPEQERQASLGPCRLLAGRRHLLAIEGFDHDGRELAQLKARRDVGRALARMRGGLLDAVLWTPPS
jgi:hypothetical protein